MDDTCFGNGVLYTFWFSSCCCNEASGGNDGGMFGSGGGMFGSGGGMFGGSETPPPLIAGLIQKDAEVRASKPHKKKDETEEKESKEKDSKKNHEKETKEPEKKHIDQIDSDGPLSITGDQNEDIDTVVAEGPSTWGLIQQDAEVRASKPHKKKDDKEEKESKEKDSKK